MKTGFVEIPGASPIYCREAGAGPALVFLHGGWGYEVYPFDRQIDTLSGRYRIVIPDRTLSSSSLAATARSCSMRPARRFMTPCTL